MCIVKIESQAVAIISVITTYEYLNGMDRCVQLVIFSAYVV